MMKRKELVIKLFNLQIGIKNEININTFRWQKQIKRRKHNVSKNKIIN